MKIEKNIAMPGRFDYDENHKINTVLKQMEVGDSIVFPLKANGGYGDFDKFVNGASNYGKKNNQKFSRRKVLEGEQEGYRVWRVK